MFNYLCFLRKSYFGELKTDAFSENVPFENSVFVAECGGSCFNLSTQQAEASGSP